MVNVTDMDNNNSFLELGPEIVQAPDVDGVRIKDPDEYMDRLKKFTSPSELMIEFVSSVFNPYTFDDTHEARWTRYGALSGFITGWLFGGLMKTRDHHEEYIRNHNASVFDGDFRAKRHHLDTFVYKIAGRGLPVACKSGLLCLGVGFVSFGSISVRNELYYPDWALGFAAIGAVSRSWLGLRGLVAGAGFGLIGGTLGYGIVRALEMASGQSVTEFRYHEEEDYMRRRLATRDRLQRKREDWVQEKFISD